MKKVDYIEWYILIGVLFLYLIWSFFIADKFRTKKIVDKIQHLLQNDGKITFPFKDKSRFIINLHHKKIDVKWIQIPTHSLLTINSKVTWKISYGGNPNKPGRVYPNERFLSELKPFLGSTKIADMKCIIFYKSVEKRVMYLNESELEILSAKSKPHGVYALTYNELEDQFLEILKSENVS